MLHGGGAVALLPSHLPKSTVYILPCRRSPTHRTMTQPTPPEDLVAHEFEAWCDKYCDRHEAIHCRDSFTRFYDQTYGIGPEGLHWDHCEQMWNEYWGPELADDHVLRHAAASTPPSIAA